MTQKSWFSFKRLYDAAVRRVAAMENGRPRFVELGVWKGESLLYLAGRLHRTFGQRFDLFAVDLWSDEATGSAHKGNTEVVAELKSMRERGESLYDTYMANVGTSGLRYLISDVRCDSAQAADQIPGMVDFVFIDADHSEDAVVRDIEAWRGKARILAGHDVSEPGVFHALRRALGSDWYEMPLIDCWTTDKALADEVNGAAAGVYLGIPLGNDGTVAGGTQNAVIHVLNSPLDVNLAQKGGSLLPYNFNALLCEALNARRSHGLLWFVMLHSDIIPLKPNWLLQLIELLESTSADVVSVVSPIKNGWGLTSAALDTSLWRPRRLTMTEIMAAPETFDSDYARRTWGADLLLNTGLMCFRLDNDWCEQVCFNIVCMNHRDEKGNFIPEVEPEDWRFSRWCNARGLKLVSTRAIPLGHRGGTEFNNFSAWGLLPKDTINCPWLADAPAAAEEHREASTPPPVAVG